MKNYRMENLGHSSLILRTAGGRNKYMQIKYTFINGKAYGLHGKCIFAGETKNGLGQITVFFNTLSDHRPQ